MRVIVVEDETAAAVNLMSMLHHAFPQMEVAAQLESVTETVEWLETNDAPDLMFLDIHLADGSAFTIFEKTEVTCPVIFTTAYDQYALEAFHLNSIDYLLKPIKEEELRRAVEKLEHLSQAAQQAYVRRVGDAMQQRRGAQSFLVHVRDRIIPLQRDRIAYCYTANERVTACDYDGAVYPLDRTLETLQSMLPEEEFFRANRQFIVARRAVKEIVVWFGSRLSLHLTVETPERIIISKARVPEFKAWLRSVRPTE